MKDEIMHLLSNIEDFYVGRSIFVTGGTGFIGKVLVEKLLRSCNGVKEIFVLMRAKKGMNVDQRLQKIFSEPLYDELRKTDPSALAKVIPVKGDVAEEGLGLGPAERQVLIDRVSVIFHVAASVRFDDNLRDAVFVNTRSTRDICVMAGSMKQLAALLHVSSTYANADKPIINEIVYPSKRDWRKAIKIAENLNNDILNAFTARYMGPVPNTYVFTKRLAEDIINEYSDRLPCVILRPSIVVATVSDPMPGWIDNFNGPLGLMTGGGKGLVRTVYANGDTIADYIPVDVTVKAMIMISCVRGRIPITKDPSAHVYNCASCNMKQITLRQLIKLAVTLNQEIPLDNCLMPPSVKTTQCFAYFYISFLLFQLLPAVIIDEILKFTGRRPILVKLQTKIYVSNKSLVHFLRNQWTFRNEKLLSLFSMLSGDDTKKFSLDIWFNINKYFKSALIGVKTYLLHEDMNQVNKAKQHLERLTLISNVCKIVFGVLIIWIFYKTGFFAHLCNTLNLASDDLPNTKVL